MRDKSAELKCGASLSFLKQDRDAMLSCRNSVGKTIYGPDCIPLEIDATEQPVFHEKQGT